MLRTNIWQESLIWKILNSIFRFDLDFDLLIGIGADSLSKKVYGQFFKTNKQNFTLQMRHMNIISERPIMRQMQLWLVLPYVDNLNAKINCS